VTASRRYRSWKETGLIVASLLIAIGARAQSTTWTPFLIITPGQISAYPGSSAGPILGSALPSWVPPVAPAWSGAQTAVPPNLSTVIGSATDNAGNVYTVYAGAPMGVEPSGYVRKALAGGVNEYFGFYFTPAAMGVTPSGDVYLMAPGVERSIYHLNSDGSTTLVVMPSTYDYPNPSVFTVDANSDITVSVQVAIYPAAGGESATQIFAATGPVPYLSGPISMPAIDGNGYVPGTQPISAAAPPLNPTYQVPYSSNPTISLSITAVSTLPVEYQWSYNGAPISGATDATLNGQYLGSGTYSVTASTSAGTVTASALLEGDVGPAMASPYPQDVFIGGGSDFVRGLIVPITASANATSQVTFQWFLNGTAQTGEENGMASQTTAGLYTSSLDIAQGGVYTVVATTTGAGGGSVTSVPLTIYEAPPVALITNQIPTISSEPSSSISLLYGSFPELNFSAISALPITYQWQLNGTDIPGATQTSYQATELGIYTAVATTTAGSVTSHLSVVSLASRPIDISTRAFVGTGANASIVGFVVASYTGDPKQLLIRAVGPTLATYGVSGVLAQPVLTVTDSAGNIVASNTGWGNSTAIAAAEASTGAFALPANSADSALLVTLAPGNYTAQVTGANGTTGIALTEVYEIAEDNGHLINISTRASVGTGADILIGGFVIGGTQATPLLIRAVGPSLSQFGVSGTLSQPILSIYDSNGNLVAVNIGWSNGSSADAVAIAGAATSTGAFALTPGSADSAVYVNLSPGSYTAQVTGENGSTGIALVEVYQVPQ
jgi:hypothetical protein